MGEQWQKRLQAEAQRHNREAAARDKEAKKAAAAERTKEAQGALSELAKILQHTLHVDDAICWNSLPRQEPFPEPKPREPQFQPISPQPQPDDHEFQLKFNLLDHIFLPFKRKKIEAAGVAFSNAHRAWQLHVNEIEANNVKQQLAYKDRFAAWNARQHTFKQQQAEENEAVAALARRYAEKDPNAILEYCDLVLLRSEYPDYMPKQWQLSHDQHAGTLVVDYMLPALDDLSTLKEVRYIVARDSLRNPFERS